MSSSPRSRRAVLGLGSNRGGMDAVRSAFDHCASMAATRLIARSAVYLSAPWGGATGGRFHNAAILIDTTLTPWGLLGELQRIERALGRRRGPRYGPRVIDIDLLWYQGARLQLPALDLPHPRLLQRRFALQPLAELAPDATVAPGLRARAALARCPDPAPIWPVP